LIGDALVGAGGPGELGRVPDASSDGRGVGGEAAGSRSHLSGRGHRAELEAGVRLCEAPEILLLAVAEAALLDALRDGGGGPRGPLGGVLLAPRRGASAIP